MKKLTTLILVIALILTFTNVILMAKDATTGYAYTQCGAGEKTFSCSGSTAVPGGDTTTCWGKCDGEKGATQTCGPGDGGCYVSILDHEL